MSMNRTGVMIIIAGLLTTVTAYAQTPRDVDDLVGGHANRGERELEDRGYRHYNTTKIRRASIGYWWQSRKSRCIAVTTSEGRFSSIVEQPNPMCGERAHGGGHHDRDVWEIAEDGVGLRRQPDRRASFVLRGLRKGDRVRVLECEDRRGQRWCRVRYRGDVGWVGESRLRQSSGRDDEWEIAENGTDIRRQPHRDSDFVVRGLRRGDRVRLFECERRHGYQWCRVSYRGDVGWVRESRLRQR